MSKKKKTAKYRKHILYHTRVGFYSIAGIAIILSLAAINYSGSSENAVLGKSDENRGKNEERREEKSEDQKQEAEKRNEEHKREIEEEFEIETDELKLEIKSKGNEIERKIKPKEIEEELDDEDEIELEDDIEEEFEEEHEVEIASSDGTLTLKKNKVRAKSEFPLSIDVATNQLIITRPDGSTKAAAILPDKAVENFTRHKKMNFIGESTGTDSAELETEISLVARDGEAVYEIKGKKKLKVLGFIPVEASTTGYVSTETGEVVDEDESFFTNILDLLSP